MVIELPKFVLVFFRIVAVLWLVPVFPSRSISIPFKVGFSMVVAFLLVNIVPATKPFGTDPYVLALLIAKEVMIGFVIGFVIRLMVAAVQAAGEIISLQSGFAFARVVDPGFGQQTTVLDQFYYLLAMMIFFAMDAHHMLIAALVRSFQELPLGTASFSEGTLGYLVASTGKVFALGLRIGAPVIVVLLLVEVSLGLLSRLIPQMNIFVEGLPLKVFITLTLIALSLGFVAPAIADLFRTMNSEMGRLMRLLG
jgi:flagellar biosynthesis protein FliR